MDPEQVILILDDEVISALGLQAQLKRAGFHHVLTATTYEQALDLYQQFGPQTAIVDINLQSDRTGLDFIREADQLSTIIILTGYEKSLYEQELAQVRYDHYMEKPVQFITIMDALAQN